MPAMAGPDEVDEVDEVEVGMERSLEAAVAAWDRRGWPRPRALLVSGSGLGVDLGPLTHGPVPLAEILPFPIHPVVGHPHRVEMLRPRADLPVLYARGRLHCYQGYEPSQAVFLVRLAALLGARTLVMTNAAGGLAPGLPPGRLVAVRDHLNLTGLNPLRGDLPPAWGPRFANLTDAYARRLRELAREHAASLGIELAEGVYAGLSGPSYETPAEARMLRILGADLTGMSTVLEVIAARHMGLECLVVSLVANAVPGADEDGGAGGAAAPVTHDEVLDTARATEADLARLLRSLLDDQRLDRL